MRWTGIMAALFLALTGAQAAAQDKAPEQGSGRYTMTPSGESMLRLDTQTGAVSECRRVTDQWVCKSVADDRLALEQEIDRLSAENRGLRAELEDRDGGKPYPGGEGDRAPGDGRPSAWLPDDKQIEEFMAFFEKLMRHLKDLVASLRTDPPRSRL